MLGTGDEKRDTVSSSARANLIGRVLGVTGSQSSIGLSDTALVGPDRENITVGKFLKVRIGKSIAIGVVTEIVVHNTSGSNADYRAVAQVYLMGEIHSRNGSELSFRRGVSSYPMIGDAVEPLTRDELRLIYRSSGRSTINIGNLQQDVAVSACLDVDEFLSKHFAVLGSTGVGKSSAVAQIVRQIMEMRPDLRIFMLDAHNEYDRCFNDRAHVVNPGNLRLPFWLFNFEEIVDVLFLGRPGLPDEVEVLSELIPLAKASYASGTDRLGLKKPDIRRIGCTADTPVPYRLVDLIALIDERMGKLENRTNRMVYHKLITRIETVSNDPRYVFMFENANVGGDTMAEAISQLFRLPPDNKPVTIMQLAGFPAEVVDAVVSVITRLAFDFGLWSEGSDPLVFICEEAHKYVSVDRTVGFGPTRRAISRIAKEGRKYGVYLGLVTQRPAEIDPTIISQCGTILAMRTSNDRDQELLRCAVSDSAANLLSFAPTLGTREALVFGTGIALPTRVMFTKLSKELVPKSEAFARSTAHYANDRDLNYVGSIIDRWRRSSMSRTSANGEAKRETTGNMAQKTHSLEDTTAGSGDNRINLLRTPREQSRSITAGERVGAPNRHGDGVFGRN